MKELGPRATILHRIETTFLDLPAYCIICRTEVEGVRMSAARIMVEKPLQGIGYAVQFSKVGSEDISPNFIPSILKRFQMKK